MAFKYNFSIGILSRSFINFKISESEIVYGCCEYDKKYILFDTLNKGIYIFEIETKTKVAVSNMIYKVDIPNYKNYGYGKMIK
jgi:hypothetical protein